MRDLLRLLRLLPVIYKAKSRKIKEISESLQNQRLGVSHCMSEYFTTRIRDLHNAMHRKKNRLMIRIGIPTRK